MSSILLTKAFSYTLEGCKISYILECDTKFLRPLPILTNHDGFITYFEMCFPCLALQMAVTQQGTN